MAPTALPFFHPAALLATWFGSGLLPKAPGTWGSLAALPFAWVIASLGGPWALLVASLAVFALGIWASELYARRAGLKDPGVVVIDEVAGQWLAIVPVALQAAWLPLAFLAFRFFDILKPWPIGWIDKQVSGGLGIMLDDMVAGLYAGLVCFGCLRLWETFW